MAKIITFPKLKLGELVAVEVQGERVLCMVTDIITKDIYKLKALQGKYKGYSAHFKIERIIRNV